jgi:hypothetical protein
MKDEKRRVSDETERNTRLYEKFGRIFENWDDDTCIEADR